MKPGDLVRVFIPGHHLGEYVGLVVNVQWYADQVSEPHSTADVLINGKLYRDVQTEILHPIDDEQMENT